MHTVWPFFQRVVFALAPQAVTMVVSLLHTVFDMLAFRNDIGFWKNNKSMEGLSARRCGCPHLRESSCCYYHALLPS